MRRRKKKFKILVGVLHNNMQIFLRTHGKKICQNRHCTITSFLAYLEAQTGFCINSSSFSFSRPLRTLFWGVLPGNKSLVIVSSGLSGNHTSNAQMDTKLANGSHNSFPSTLIPDLKVPANKYVYSYKCMIERQKIYISNWQDSKLSYIYKAFLLFF